MGQIRFIRFLRSGLIGALAIGGLSSCYPYHNDTGDLDLSLTTSETILLNAPATSCKARFDSTTATPSQDISPLQMSLGKFRIKWTPPNSTTNLRVIYLQINLISSGISNSATPIFISGEALQCIMRYSIGGDQEVLTSTDTDFLSQKNIVIGGLKNRDTTNKNPIFGTANVILYGLLGNDDDGYNKPVIGRTQFQFKFSGTN